MKDHSLRVLLRLISIIDRYKNKEISLNELINSLEGSIYSLEEKLPEDFVCKYNQYILNLDTAVGLGIELKAKTEISEDLENLKNIILEQINKKN
jgi:hypothetical protein